MREFTRFVLGFPCAAMNNFAAGAINRSGSQTKAIMYARELMRVERETRGALSQGNLFDL